MTPPKSYVCPRANRPPVLDGRLTDPVWDAAPWTDDFVDIEGDLRPKPPLRTRVKMLWDDHFLYIGADLEEPHVWATLTEHDSVIFQDNDFEVFIDPDGDNHNYYELEINALNTTWDLRLVTPYRDGGPALNNWEIPGMRTAVHVDGTLNDPRDRDRGWSVELALPWKALGEYARRPAPPRSGDQWRINFSRVEWDVITEGAQTRKVPDRPEHNWVWSPQGVIDMHRPERWGYLQFTDGSPATARFRLDGSQAARDFLMAVYHAQRAFQARTGNWAETLAALPVPVPAAGLASPRLRSTTTGFVAEALYTDPKGRSVRLQIDERSRLWVPEPPRGS
jgi:hypothetical protein